MIGQTFSDGKLTLEVSEFFYKGEIVPLSDVRNALEDAGIVNIVGKRSIAHAIEHGYITEDNIIVIDGVPHAQTVTMPASPQAP
ncbi:MAG: hypothetical protein C5S52_02950 [ANME-2 cluster archaeon]|nr:hypothetical protein [ANME-2 cluster archaeon]